MTAQSWIAAIRIAATSLLRSCAMQQVSSVRACRLPGRQLCGVHGMCSTAQTPVRSRWSSTLHGITLPLKRSLRLLLSPPVELRLVNGTGPMNGRLEASLGGVWGRVRRR